MAICWVLSHGSKPVKPCSGTGTSKVPLEGFKALVGMRGLQKFNIHKAYGGEKTLPSAHTCFNQLDLPEYTSQEQTTERLRLACREGSEGFGFG